MNPIDPDDIGPTVEDLAAIDAEWPVLAAELAVVHAECRLLNHPSELAHRAFRRAQKALATVQLQAHDVRPTRLPHPRQGVS